MAMPTPIAMEMRTCLSSTRQILRNAARSIQLSYTARTTLCSPESFHDVIDRRFGPHFHSFPSGEVFEALDQHDVRLEVREKIGRRSIWNATRGVAVHDGLTIAGENDRPRTRGDERCGVAAVDVRQRVMRVLDRSDRASFCYETANQFDDERCFPGARRADQSRHAHGGMTISPPAVMRCAMKRFVLMMLLVASAAAAEEQKNLTISVESLGDNDTGVVTRVTYRFTIPAEVPDGG